MVCIRISTLSSTENNMLPFNSKLEFIVIVILGNRLEITQSSNNAALMQTLN